MTKSQKTKSKEGRRWDGKSRPATDKYKKNYNEINWGNMDEIAEEMKKNYSQDPDNHEYE